MTGAEVRLKSVPLGETGESKMLGEATDNAKSLGRELTFSKTLPVGPVPTEAC